MLEYALIDAKKYKTSIRIRQFRIEQTNIELHDMATTEKAINQIRFPVE